MVNTFSGWLFNVILWASIATLVLLVVETFSRGFLVGQVDEIRALIGVVIIAVLALWPRF
jgi:hypothetical protein